MSQKALEIMLKRKKLLKTNPNDRKTLNALFEQAQKAGGLTSEERYVLMLEDL